MPTTSAMTGTISSNATSPTMVALPYMAHTVSVSSSDSGSGGKFGFEINSATISTANTSSSFVFANGIPHIIQSAIGVGTLTMYANNTLQTYCIAINSFDKGA